MTRMVDARAEWHTPTRVLVDTSADVGLSIGQTGELQAQIEQNLPRTVTRSAGTVKVGTDLTATLIGDPMEVQIEPRDAIDASTGSAIGLLWTWKIHPLRPNDELRLTAHLKMTVPGTNHGLTKNVPLTLKVHRTNSYTAHQVFTNWATWAAIVAAAAGLVRWLWPRLLSGRTRRNRSISGDDEDRHDQAAPQHP
jgi:hypothetical protein